MESPKIAAKNPAILNLKPGEYYWCSCGKSKNQPFCDGSHTGSAFSPVCSVQDRCEKGCFSLSVQTFYEQTILRWFA
ncbi:MAG: CDGSH iron-sulfur domain-containing protein [Draconibacterium sp.]|nr:CDGSH iron-sulfur domain-containing protein [Draconibacterium sp.]